MRRILFAIDCFLVLLLFLAVLGFLYLKELWENRKRLTADQACQVVIDSYEYDLDQCQKTLDTVTRGKKSR